MSLAMLAFLPHSHVERRQELISAVTKALLKTGTLTLDGDTLVQVFLLRLSLACIRSLLGNMNQRSSSADLDANDRD